MEISEDGNTVEFLLSDEAQRRLAAHARKMLRFQQAGYIPHYGQQIFHTSWRRYRSLAAGRQGGKTHSAAYEFAHLCDPDYRDDLRAYGVDLGQNEVCIGYIVTPDRSNYETTPTTFTEALEALEIEYEFSTAKQTWYLPSKANCKTKIVYKSAKDPNKLRGGHPHIIWFDEPGFSPNAQSWVNMRASTVKSRGIAIFSTTPADNENYYWLYDLVILRAKGGRDGSNKKVKHTPDYGYYAWTTAENPHVSLEEMELQWEESHPIDFAREFLARWDRGQGKLLKSDWLHRFTEKSLHFVEGGETLADLDRDRYHILIGADLASRQKTTSDYFAAWVLAVDKQTRVGYLIDKIHDRISFPDQVKVLTELIDRWGPLALGIESTGYQISLAQELQRLHPGVQIYPIEAVGSKEDRIISMSPTFRNGAVRIWRHGEGDFIQEWITFPNGAHDDLLDAAEITLRTALFAMVPLRTNLRATTTAPTNSHPRAADQYDDDDDRDISEGWDENLGMDW